MTDTIAEHARLAGVLDALPRVAVTHAPTPLEPLHNLGRDLGLSLYAKRDDCTGFGFGGNKIRQLEFYFGAAREAGADTVLITGAVQSNYARSTAAMAARFEMECHIQLEERVSGADRLYHESGNVLLDKLAGAVLHSYPTGEDEAGADRALQTIAADLERAGKRPFVIPLGPGHKPLGALGYSVCAMELDRQIREQGLKIDHIVVPSGSAFTHAGLLYGLRMIGSKVPVLGICVRRDATAQRQRVTDRTREIGEMIGLPIELADDDVAVFDGVLAPGYGRIGEPTREAMALSARREGLYLDPVYTGKTMAGLIAASRSGLLAGDNVVFIHTGGLPALFAYGDSVL